MPPNPEDAPFTLHSFLTTIFGFPHSTHFPQSWNYDTGPLCGVTGPRRVRTLSHEARGPCEPRLHDAALLSHNRDHNLLPRREGTTKGAGPGSELSRMRLIKSSSRLKPSGQPQFLQGTQRAFRPSPREDVGRHRARVTLPCSAVASGIGCGQPGPRRGPPPARREDRGGVSPASCGVGGELRWRPAAAASDTLAAAPWQGSQVPWRQPPGAGGEAFRAAAPPCCPLGVTLGVARS